MKRFALALCLGLGALSANAQMNYKVQTACHPQDVKHRTPSQCLHDGQSHGSG